MPKYSKQDHYQFPDRSSAEQAVKKASESVGDGILTLGEGPEVIFTPLGSLKFDEDIRTTLVRYGGRRVKDITSDGTGK